MKKIAIFVKDIKMDNNLESNIETNEDNELVETTEIVDISDNQEEIDLVEINSEQIQNLIYTIRDKQVMLDSDLAMLYQVETKNLNKAMRRNIDRFPENFCFRLTDDEFETLRFQNGTSKKTDGRGGRRFNLYVFRTRNSNVISCFKK